MKAEKSYSVVIHTTKGDNQFKTTTKKVTGESIFEAMYKAIESECRKTNSEVIEVYIAKIQNQTKNNDTRRTNRSTRAASRRAASK